MKFQEMLFSVEENNEKHPPPIPFKRKELKMQNIILAQHSLQ